jgi:hypothetical protein
MKATKQGARKVRRAKNIESPADRALSPDLAKATIDTIFQNVRDWSIEENDQGKLARAILRANRDGNRETAARLMKPIALILARISQMEKPNHSEEDGCFSEPPTESEMRKIRKALVSLRPSGRKGKSNAR